MTYAISHDPAAKLWIVHFQGSRVGAYSWLCDAQAFVADLETIAREMDEATHAYDRDRDADLSWIDSLREEAE